jgi:hypothetical protein
VLETHIASLIQAVADKPIPDKVWPTSVGAWIAVFLSGGLLIDRIKNRGKKEGIDETALNGIGSRVEKVEKAQERMDGQFQEHQRSVDRVLGEHGNLLTALGKAERSSERCLDDMQKFTIDIGSKIDNLRREVVEQVSDIKVSLEGVKTEVRLRAEFEERERK